MKEKVNVTLVCGGEVLLKSIKKGKKISELLKKDAVKLFASSNLKAVPCAAIVNGEMHSLCYSLEEDCRCELIDYYTTEGYRMYIRTIKFVFLMALKRVFPKGGVRIENKIGGNFKVEFVGIPKNEESIAQIYFAMIDIVKKDLNILKEKVSYRNLRRIYHENDMDEQAEFYSLKIHDTYSVNSCKGYYNYLYGRLLPTTGYLLNDKEVCFSLKLYEKDIILQMPRRDDISKFFDIISSEKIDSAFYSFKEFSNNIGISSVSRLNEIALDEAKIKNVIKIFENDQLFRIGEIVTEVVKRNNQIVFISGPSSSGKTTLSQKLEKAFKKKGIVAHAISMDDYFFEPDDSPVDENGNKNFESVNHLDKEFFKSQITSLLDGKDVIIPHYNFKLGGKREFHDENRLKLEKNDVLIIEGIHALNPYVSDFMDESTFYKVYAAPLLTLAYDNFTKVSSNDTRLLRRIVRDWQTRNLSIENTFEKWAKVKEGEEKNIFPFVDKANYIFNTSLPYEICVMKLFAENLLLLVPETSKWYSEARRLYSMLQNFRNIFTTYIPKDSIIREFIGSGCFKR